LLNLKPKKMNFNDFKNSENLLSNEQMKNVKGGSGTCGYLGPVVNGAQTIMCGISYSTAMFMFDGGGGGARWCCDSCSSTSYCGSMGK